MGKGSDALSSSTGLEVKIARHVEEIGQEAWDHLRGTRPFASYRWYRFVEKVMADDMPLYIVVSHRGEPVARATFWLVRREPLSLSSVIVRQCMEALTRRWPLLICRSPLASTSGLILPETPLRETALRAIAQAALERARSAHASFVLFDYLDSQAVLEPGWLEAFAAVSLPEPGTYLDIAWPDFDSYINQLSYKTRKNYRRNCRAADRLGVEIKSYPAVTMVDEALALIANVERRYNDIPYPWTRRILENAAMVDAVWLTAEINGRLMGCELMLGDGDTWLVTALGLDYSVQYVYFRLGYEDIRYAIERGVRRLRWGSCTYEVKQRLGFQLENNSYVVFAANGPVLNWVWPWVKRWSPASQILPVGAPAG